MKNNRFEVITLKFMSYNKIQFFSNTKKDIKKKLFKDFKKILILMWASLRPFKIFKIKFNKLKTYSKVYTVVKGPKCHKKGKHILKYTYYTYEIVITKKINLNKSLYNLVDYFSSLLESLKLYDSNYSPNNKVILNTYINL